MEPTKSDYHAPSQLRIGHIHLKVADLDRSISFYRDIMGFDLLQKLGKAAFLSVGGYHHHIALNTWHSLGGEKAPKNQVGLYHFALNYPTRKDLALIYKRLVKVDYSITAAYDHTTHLAIYISDPDGNGIELAWDRDPSYWKFMFDSSLTIEKLRGMDNHLDLQELLNEAE
jgi:catechol 2,3-dioxygenase